jgi:3-oxoacyl-[acyl-carrier-protein] synthase-3
MGEKLRTIITGSGSYIPTVRVPNSAFLSTDFYTPNGEFEPYTDGPNKGKRKPTREIVEKLGEITGIKERRYVTPNLVTSDISALATKDCIESSGSDSENYDFLIVAHNFGDVDAYNRRSDFVPSLASRVKRKLGIKTPKMIVHDTPFGCPGWVMGLIQADSYLKSGNAKSGLVSGAETLSRVSCHADKDSMIYADGAGTVEVISYGAKEEAGILSHASRSDASELLRMAKSYDPNYRGEELFLKMDGHELFKYALKNVAGVVKESLDRAGLGIENIDKILLHQANDRLDYKIAEKLFKLYGIKPDEELIRSIMPMTISWLGNSSVATLPTLYDLLVKSKFDNPNSEPIQVPDVFNGNPLVPEVIRDALARGGSFVSENNNLERKINNSNHTINPGDLLVFASVGAGMNINSIVYRVPSVSLTEEIKQYRMAA